MDLDSRPRCYLYCPLDECPWVEGEGPCPFADPEEEDEA